MAGPAGAVGLGWGGTADDGVRRHLGSKSIIGFIIMLIMLISMMESIAMLESIAI